LEVIVVEVEVREVVVMPALLNWVKNGSGGGGGKSGGSGKK
jgi:hypothetical protein